MKTFYRFVNKEGKLQFVEAKGKQHKVSKYILFMTRGDEDKGESKWILTEKDTGQKMGEGKTQKAALENVKSRLEDYGEEYTDRQIELFVERYGGSPIADES